MANLQNTVIAGSLRLSSHGAGMVRTSANGTISSSPMTSADLPSHTHDDRYYTESESDARFFRKNTWEGNSYISTDGTFYGTIFYDSNNTGYYLDPAGTTNLNVTYTNYLYVNGSQITGDQITYLKNTLDSTSLPYKCDIYVDGDANTYYPVHFIWGDQDVWRRIIIKRGYSEEAPWDPIGTGAHHGGLLLDWEGNFGGWGGAEYSDRLRVFNESYTNVCADMYIYTHSMGYVFMLRGGHALYHIFSDQPIRGYHQTGTPDIAYNTSTLFYDHSNTSYRVYAPAPVTTVNSSRIDGLRTKKQSLFDNRYLRQGVDINGIGTITTTNSYATNFMAANAFYLNGQSYYLNSYNGGIYTNARFESASNIYMSGNLVATQAWVQAQGYRTTDSDNQTLSISGSTLSISGGNSVTIPSGGITSESDTLATVTARGNTTSSSAKFGSHVDLNVNNSAFRFYDGSTFRGGLGLDDWAHGGSAANITMYVNGDNIFYVSTSGVRRHSFSSGEAVFRTYSPDLNYGVSITGGDQINVKYGDGYTTMYLNYAGGSGANINMAAGRLTVNTAGSVVASGDMRAPIFYDSNDTSYYVDPNSTSNLAASYIGRVLINYDGTDTWFRMQSGNRMRITTTGGTDFIVPNTGEMTYNGNTVIHTGNIGSQSVAYSDRVRGQSGYPHVGYGMWAFYNWGGNNGGASAPTDSSYTIGISVGSHPNDQAYGFQIGRNMWNTGLWTRGYDSGFGSWVRLLDSSNYNSYSPTLTGGNASGTWSISITGNADTVDGYHVGNSTNQIAYWDSSRNLYVNNPESYSGEVRLGAAWGRGGVYASSTLSLSTSSGNIDFVHGNNTTARLVGSTGNYGPTLMLGTTSPDYTLIDGNIRPVVYLHGAYPVLTLNHTVTSNGSHGPTIQFTHHTADKQWVIGSNGTGTQLDIGYSTYTANRNPHNGIADYNGSTFFRIDNGGNIQLGRGNGRSTWVNDTLYVGANDSGDAHMYFGEDSSNWYGLHWYWDSGYTVYLYGRNAGSDTQIMRYVTNDNSYVHWTRHFHMNNYEVNYVGQLHLNNGFALQQSGSYGYINNWLKIGTTGIFSDNNSAHIYPNTSTSYGSWRMDGSRNGWRGINFAGNVTLMMNDNETGFYRDGYGWQWRWENGTGYIHKNGQGGGTSAVILDSSNWTSYVTTLQGYSAYNLVEEARGVHSGSDFPNGTLVTTDIYADGWSGDSFVMEVSGKSYDSSNSPFKLIMQGYLYADTIINVSAMSYGSYFPGPVKVMRYNGNIAFWWPRGSYWNSFQVHVRDAGGSSWNRVTGISNSSEPAGDKKISITPIQVLHTSNASYAYNMNQNVRTSDSVTFNNIYANGWFRNYGAQGLYNESYGTHFYSRSGAKWAVTGSGGNIHLEFRSNHESTLRGVVYADTSNQIGFLNNGEGWSFRTNSSNNAFVHGQTLTINADGAGWSSIYMNDGDEGNREIHCNSNRIGFLNQSGNWGAWCSDDGSWNSATSIYASDYVYTNYSIRVGEIWGLGGLYRSSGDMLFGTESSADWYFRSGNNTRVRIAGGDGNIWMSWAGDWISNLLGAKQNASTAITTSNIGSQSVAYASESYIVRSTNDYRHSNRSPDSWHGLANSWHFNDRDTVGMSGSDYWVSILTVVPWYGFASSHRQQQLGFGGAAGLYHRYANDGSSWSGWSRIYSDSYRPYADSAGNADTVDGYHESAFWRDNQNRTIGVLQFTGVGGDSGNGSQPTSYGIYQQGGSWSHPYPDLCIGYHTGIKIGAYYGYNGTRFYNNSDWATITASVNDGDNNFRGYYDVIAYASDKRLKENIEVIENALDKIMKLTGMTYTWNSVGNQYGWQPGTEREAGVFAQDVQAVLPEAVRLAPFDNDGGKSKSGENFLTVKYEKLVPLLIEAIKEQQKQIEELKSKLV